MDIFALFGLVVIGSAIGMLVKAYRPDIYVPYAVAAGTVILLVTLGQFKPIAEQMSEFASRYDVSNAYVTAAFKVTGIACLTQFGSNLCKDMGESAIAGKAEFAGRVMILCVAVPVVLNIFSVIGSFAENG